MTLFGYCHLLKDTTLENLIEMPDTFLPFTNTTIYMSSNPSAPWQREVTIVNKEQLEAIYQASD